MKKMYPASPACNRVLKHPPKMTHCLLSRDLKTLKNLSNVVVFLWLANGKGFWYHLLYVKGDVLIGHALRGSFWRYTPVNRQQVLRYY